MCSSPPSPPPAKGRTSFINRRESLLAPNIVQENPKVDEIKEKEMYYNKLQNEEVAWRQLFNQTRAKHSELKWKMKHDSVNPIPMPQCHELLDDKAREFLEQKPDLAKIRSEAVEYCQNTNDLLSLWVEMENRNHRLMEAVHEKVAHLEKQALETSNLDTNIL